MNLKTITIAIQNIHKIDVGQIIDIWQMQKEKKNFIWAF